jgi:transposase InsO family protein
MQAHPVAPPVAYVNTSALIQLGPLDCSRATAFASYVERFDLICQTDNTIDSKRTIYFLTAIGETAYDLAKNLCFPTAPKDVTFDELIAKLKAHIEPRVFVAKERKNFDRLIQGSMSVIDFVVNLQSASKHCNFGESLDERLKDRFIAGCSNNKLVAKLLGELDLTWAKTKTIAEMHESVYEAAKDSSSSVLLSSKGNSRGRGRGKYFRQPVTRPGEVLHGSTSQKSLSSTSAPNFSNRGRGGRTPAPCHGCGGNHMRVSCPYKTYECRQCHGVGHLARVCKRIKHGQGTSNHSSGFVEPSSAPRDSSSAHTSGQAYSGLAAFPSAETHIFIELESAQSKAKFVVDSGSPCSFISQSTLRLFDPTAKIVPTAHSVRGVSGSSVVLLGESRLQVRYGSQSAASIFLVTKDSPCIAGLDLLQSLALQLDCASKTISQSSPAVSSCYVPSVSAARSAEMSKLIDECAQCTGGMSIPPVDVHLQGAPVFLKARPLPYGMVDLFHSNLQKRIDAGQWYPVAHSQWATPVVTIRKPDANDLRICGDYSVTVNPLLANYPSPTLDTEEFLARVSGHTCFSVIDLESAFQQIPLTPSAQELTTINTIDGLFRSPFLVFGWTVSPTIFASELKKVVADLPGVQPYVDDILVSGETEEQHNLNLLRVLRRFKDKNVRINTKKSVFGVKSVKYLGYVIDSKGIHPDLSRADALLQASAPKDHVQLRSVVCAFQFYSRFVPNFSMIAEPLFQLQNQKDFVWSSRHDEAFSKLKALIASPPVLQPFSVRKHSTVVTDASETGIGAVLEQDGHPVLFVSRRLSSSERGYSQTQRESLALKFALLRLQKFLLGCKFTLVTDHAALVHIFGSSVSKNKTTAMMLQRWAAALSGFDFDVVYSPGKRIPFADFLSRFCKMEPASHDHEFEAYFSTNLPIPRNDLVAMTKRQWSSLLHAVRYGFSLNMRKKFPQFYVRRDELSVSVDQLILLDELIVVPPSLRERFLSHLHVGHLGVDKMKSLARMICWWPELSSDIRTYVEQCRACASNTHRRTKSLHPWPVTFAPWQRLHIDYAGPLFGHWALIVVDSFSKWPEILFTTSASSEFTVRALRRIFAREGIPHVVVSDNGTHFTGQPVREFLQRLDIVQLFSPPRHPQSNGLAENMVRTFKSAVAAAEVTSFAQLEEVTDRFLLAYRNAIHATSHERPTVALHGRVARTNIVGATRVTFQVGNDYRDREGIILSQTGSRIVVIMDVLDGSTHRRHRDQIRVHYPTTADKDDIDLASQTVTGRDTELQEEHLPQQPEVVESVVDQTLGQPVLPSLPHAHLPLSPGVRSVSSSPGTEKRLSTSPQIPPASMPPHQPHASTSTQLPLSPTQPRRSSRVRRPPDRLNLYTVISKGRDAIWFND